MTIERSELFRSSDDANHRLGISLSVTKHIGLDEVISLVHLAEDRGFDSVWIPETWGSDAGTVLALLSATTRHIKLASGVFNVYSRSAGLIAQTAATLQDASHGRFSLGLGVSGPKVIQQWHSVAYGSPLRRTREYVAAIRLALDGVPVEIDGSYVHMSGFRLTNPPREPIPVYLAALGPKNIELAAEIADGWLPIFSTVKWLGDRLNALRDASARLGQVERAVDIAPFLPCVFGHNAEQLLRQQVAYYLGGMGSFYARMMAKAGFEKDVAHIRSAWQSGERIGAARWVSNELLSACTLGTDTRTAGERIRAYRDAGVGLPILSFPQGAKASQVADTIESLSPTAT